MPLFVGQCFFVLQSHLSGLFFQCIGFLFHFLKKCERLFARLSQHKERFVVSGARNRTAKHSIALVELCAHVIHYSHRLIGARQCLQRRFHIARLAL